MGPSKYFSLTGPRAASASSSSRFNRPVRNQRKKRFTSACPIPTTGLYQSTDNGVTWAVVAGQPTAFRPNHYALGPDGVMYITYGDGTGEDGMGGDRIGNGAVWKYDTLGNLWTDVTPKGPWGATSLWYGFGAAAVDRQNPNNVVVSTMGRWWPGDTVYRSADAGETWLSLSSEPDTGLNYSVRDDSLSPYLNFGQGCTATSCDTSLAHLGVDRRISHRSVRFQSCPVRHGCDGLGDARPHPGRRNAAADDALGRRGQRNRGNIRERVAQSSRGSPSAERRRRCQWLSPR